MSTHPGPPASESGRASTIDPVPPELSEAVAREAACDAGNVALFLSELGFTPSAGHRVRHHDRLQAEDVAHQVAIELPAAAVSKEDAAASHPSP